jgi:hypothetical protein
MIYYTTEIDEHGKPLPDAKFHAQAASTKTMKQILAELNSTVYANMDCFAEDWKVIEGKFDGVPEGATVLVPSIVDVE